MRFRLDEGGKENYGSSGFCVVIGVIWCAALPRRRRRRRLDLITEVTIHVLHLIGGLELVLEVVQLHRLAIERLVGAHMNVSVVVVVHLDLDEVIESVHQLLAIRDGLEFGKLLVQALLQLRLNLSTLKRLKLV